MGPVHQTILELFRLSSGGVIPERSQILELAVEIVGEDSVVLFWAYDSLEAAYLLANRCDPKSLLLDSQISGVTAKNITVPSASQEGTYKQLPALARLRLPFQSVINVTLDESEDTDEQFSPSNIGCLHIFSATTIDKAKNEALGFVARALASAVVRWRRRRIRQAFTQLQEALSENNSGESWLERSVSLLQKITHANVCIAFRASRDRTVKAVAIAPSVLRSILPLNELVGSSKSILRFCIENRKSIRIGNFLDSGERERIIDRRDYDEDLELKIRKLIGGRPVQSLLAEPIESDTHVTTVIALYNKSDYLPQRFTETDFEIVSSVCRFLAGTIPSIEMPSTMERLSEVFSGADLNDEKQRSEIYETLSKTIPSVSGAMLGVKNWGALNFERIHFGGETSALSSDAFNITKAVESIPNQHFGRYCVKIPGLDKTAHLSLILSDKNLSKNELRTLKFFITQLGQTLRAEEIIETEIRRLVETRHAVRSGLNGLSHLDEALTCFDLIARDGYVASPILLRRAYKSIRRSAMFAEKSRTLMEESRYLLTDITSTSLRIAPYLLSKLIHRVQLCLAPEAEEKEVIVDVDIRIPQSQDEMHNDPMLIEIVVFNLIDNAIKYSLPQKHVHVKAFIRSDKWCVEVADEGALISDDDRPGIFMPFERRVKGNWAQSTTGTGIGLAVAKKIIRAHDGLIDFTSKPISDNSSVPAKTVFFITVPRKPVTDTP